MTGAVLPVQEGCPVFSEGEDQHTVLQAAAMATKWWEPARDALDTMVLSAARTHQLEGYQHTDFMPFDPAVKVSSHISEQERRILIPACAAHMEDLSTRVSYGAHLMGCVHRLPQSKGAIPSSCARWTSQAGVVQSSRVL